MRLIDADFEEQHYTSIMLNPTQDVTAKDRDNSKIIINALKMAKTVDVPQWIPCSERLPEKPENYPSCETRRKWYLVSLESGCVETIGYEFDRDEWQITGSPVIAWMPLPEPYKGEK